MRKHKPRGITADLSCDLSERCRTIALYMLEHHATVRQAAQQFGLSKSSVHKDMHHRLGEIDPVLARQVALLLNYHKAVRHLRGGAATRQKFREVREQREMMERG